MRINNFNINNGIPMKANKLPQSALSGAQAAGSHSQQPQLVYSHDEYNNNAPQTKRASNDASYLNSAHIGDSVSDKYDFTSEDKPSQSSRFGYKSVDNDTAQSTLLDTSESDMIAYQHLTSDNKDSANNAGVFDTANAYEQAQKLNEDEPLMSALLDDQTDHLTDNAKEAIVDDSAVASVPYQLAASLHKLNTWQVV